MLNIHQVRHEIIRPALQETDTWSQSAENIIVGTGLVESRFTYLMQTPAGPARGVYQIETDSYYDVVKYLRRKDELRNSILKACHYKDFPRTIDALVSNLKYATLMCRAFYWRFEEPLPNADDLDGLAKYYCKYYNTYLGRSKSINFTRLYNKYGCIKKENRELGR